MPFLVINRRRSRHEEKLLERIARALEAISETMRPTAQKTNDLRIDWIDKTPRAGENEADREELPDESRMP